VMILQQLNFRRALPWLSLILPGVMLISLAPILAASAGSDTAPADMAKQGSEIFHKRCFVCHNKQPGDTTPFGPPNLYTVFRGHSALTSQQAEDVIVHGRGQMPAWGAILTRSEIKSVIWYLRKR